MKRECVAITVDEYINKKQCFSEVFFWVTPFLHPTPGCEAQPQVSSSLEDSEEVLKACQHLPSSLLQVYFMEEGYGYSKGRRCLAQLKYSAKKITHQNHSHHLYICKGAHTQAGAGGGQEDIQLSLSAFSP